MHRLAVSHPSIGGKIVLNFIIPYCAYYKPTGDLAYISSEQGVGLIIMRSWLIYEYTYISVLYLPIQELRAEERVGL